MSSDPFEGLFDRDELLAGLPAKRANALLFLIESRTAQLVARSRRATERFLTEEAAQERELAFLEAAVWEMFRNAPPSGPEIEVSVGASGAQVTVRPRRFLGVGLEEITLGVPLNSSTVTSDFANTRLTFMTCFASACSHCCLVSDDDTGEILAS